MKNYPIDAEPEGLELLQLEQDARLGRLWREAGDLCTGHMTLYRGQKNCLFSLYILGCKPITTRENTAEAALESAIKAAKEEA